jgi:hypothetical protein
VQIKSQKDFLSGLMFMCVGLGFAWGASAYKIGTSAQMGAGYFPVVLGIILVALGGMITFKALVVETVDGDKIGSIAWRPLIHIIAANLVLGVSLGGLPVIGLQPLGLVAGIYLLTIIASLAGKEFKLSEVLVLATVLNALSYLAFIVLLKLQLPIWPVFLSSAAA